MIASKENYKKYIREDLNVNLKISDVSIFTLGGGKKQTSHIGKMHIQDR